MTISDAINVYRALGQVSSVKDDSLRWNIAKNKRILKNEIDLYDEARIAIIKELSPENSDVSKESSALQAQFMQRDRALQKKPAELPGFLLFTQAQATGMTQDPNVIEALLPAIQE